MIFDFLSTSDFEKVLGPTPRKPAFNSQATGSSAFRRNLREEGEANHYNYAIVRRQESIEDKCTRDDAVLFVIGEAYSSARYAARKREPECRLGAPEILSLWTDEPTGFQNYLKGNFQLVLINEREAECSLWNSRFGISPFYYAVRGSCFYCSTSLSELIRFLPSTPEFDAAAIAELALLNYPLLGRTFSRDVHALQSAEVVKFRSLHLRSSRYWNILPLFQQDTISREEAFEEGSSLLRSAVNLRASDVGPISLSLTGGFDGRANLAAIQKEPSEIQCYAFGIPGSLNLTIPEGICRKEGYLFKPIVLDAAYEKVFQQFAEEALFSSDCLATIERANYPYAFRLLCEWSPVVITGIFGSELLRTFQNVGVMVSPVYASLSASPRDSWMRILKEASRNGQYFSKEYMATSLPEVLADLDSIADSSAYLQSTSYRFHHFLFTEGLRKYFGAEVHMERRYATNRFPYLDDDFVEFAFRAPFAGIRSTVLSPTPRERFESQYFYAEVMRRYRPQMLRYTTDHGFAPADLLKRFPLLWIGPKFLFHRQKLRMLRYREYKTQEWTADYYHARADLLQTLAHPVVGNLMLSLNDGSWIRNRLDFAKAASFRIWSERVFGMQ